jgi:hypothetical protein
MRILPNWWRAHFLTVELGLAILLGAAVYVWGVRFEGSSTLHTILSGNRGAIYGALASVFGSLLGFAITAVSVVIGFASHDRLAIIRQSRHYPTLWRVFFAAIRALGLATLLALAGLVLDRDNYPRDWVLYLTTFASLLAVLRVARCAWILENVIDLVTIEPDQHRTE